MHFEFATATRILFGWGKLREAGGIAAEFGARALLVTGRSSSRAEPLRQVLERAGVTTVAFPVPHEPDLELVQSGVQLAKQEKCELVISFGGGSALDAGKAVAALIRNDGELMDYLEVIGRGRPLRQVSAPFIAIPTTAGTGAEVTRNAVLSSPEHRVKVSLRSPLMLPTVALVDPELTLGLPKAVTAATGLDALTQLLEAFVCSRANPMTDALCLEGLRRAARALPIAYHDGANRSAREDMSLASLLSGIALANAGLGAVHGFAGPIGGMFDAPHGAVCAILLPRVMAANIRALRARAPDSKSLERYTTAAEMFTGAPSSSPERGIEWVQSLVSEMEIPPLRKYGLTTQDSAELVKNASAASSMKANPVQLTSEELAAVLTSAL